MADYFGSTTADTLTGSSDNDNIDVGVGGEPFDTSDNDTAAGGGGDDVIIHLQRGDSADGGEGTDKAQVWLMGQWDDYFSTVNQTYNSLGLDVDLTDAAGAGTLVLQYGGQYGGTVTLTSIEVYDVTFGSGNDTAWGGDGDDTLNGEAYSFTLNGLGFDELHGRGGNDTINGMAAADYLYGDGGNDTMDGGVLGSTGGFDDLAGDFIYGADGDDTITVRALDYADGGDNTDMLVSYYWAAATIDLAITSQQDAGFGDITILNFENITGSGYGDVLWGTDAANSMRGNGGDDEIHGRGGDDVIYGGQFAQNHLYGDGDNDTIYGHSGFDYIDGGTGNDHMYGDGGNDTYIVDSLLDVPDEADPTYHWDMGGTDEVRTALTYTLGQFLENLVLTGAAAVNGYGNGLNNTITGNAAVNRMRGEGGNDTLDGAAGADFMYGQAGDDTYVIDNAGDTVSESISGVDDGGTDTVEASISYTLRAHFENLTLTGSADLTGTGNGLANIVTGNAGANVINGAGGADSLYGGGGNDTYVVDNLADFVSEQIEPGQDDGGVDVVNSGVTFTLGDYVENLTLTGTGTINGTGNDLGNRLTGNGSNNRLFGLDGDDFLNGQGGADVMKGGVGNDTYVVDNAGDVCSEVTAGGVDEGGRDVVNASVSYSLAAFIEVLNLTGSANTDGTGNSVANALTGNGGANVLAGRGGNDTLTGNGGADTFVFAHFGGANGYDTIRDFVSGTDRLSFTGADYGFAAGHVLGAGEISFTGAAVGGTAQFVYNGTTHVLAWDSNGAAAGGVTNLCVFSNGAAPVAADFVFT